MRLIRTRKIFFITIFVLTITILVTALLVFNTMRTLPTRNIRILFGVEGYSTLTLIEFVEPDDFKIYLLFPVMGLLEETDLIDDFFYKVPWINRGDTRGVAVVANDMFYLSSEQLRDIQKLVESVVRNGSDGEFARTPFVRGHLPHVWAIIDGNLYWSYYTSDFREEARRNRQFFGLRAERDFRQYKNHELLTLAYRLIDLSPIPIGGEHLSYSFGTPERQEPILRRLFRIIER